MSGGMPELGSKISLISKADIRYEGRLYTVDPQECTIALSSVRSFGTEDRDTQFQIAPQSQIYDYILFRGSDIKDIRVINNSLPHPNDPAIMQVQLPNGQHLMPHFSMPNITAAQAQPLGAAGAYGASFGNMAGLGSISSSAVDTMGNGLTGTGNGISHNSSNNSNNVGLLGIGLGISGSGGVSLLSGIGIGGITSTTTVSSSTAKKLLKNSTALNEHKDQGVRGFRQIILPRNNKNPIKFEQDFDFEQANNKFEELRSQLSKLKVGDEPKSSEQINGETDKKDDSGNETGAGEHEPEEEEITVGYDKTKSFFDNISCEAAQDRTKNKGHDWRQERKLNSETFGVSSTRRGGYRGHSNYYNNRNMGGGYGGNGGYNRGYRGGNQYRNRSNNRNNHNNNNRDANTGVSRSHNNGANLNNNSNNIMKNQTQQQQQQQPQQQQQQQQQQPPQLLGNMSNATNSVTVAPNPNSAPTISKSSSAGLSDNTKMIATVGAGE
uniref:DFDF domain-containing protein n=1 Tax=Glossina pallidipes TaxID=7398 RepID=A0A1B0A6E7_GLOPL